MYCPEMYLNVTKHVLCISDKARLKSVSSAQKLAKKN